MSGATVGFRRANTVRSSVAARTLVLMLLAAGLLTSGCAAEVARMRATTAAASATSTTVPAPVADPGLPAVTVTVPGLDEPSSATAELPTDAAGAEDDVIDDADPELAVDLESCATCTEVLAAAPTVVGDYGAALVAMTKKRAGLAAVGPDGAVVKPQIVRHQMTVRAPADGILPCDAAARCVVLGNRVDGTAIAAAYALAADGTWADLSGENAFPSATDKAAVIDVDGALGIAVQESGAGKTGWIVLTWSGARYTVAGCAADSDTPPAAADLTTEACLS